MVTVHLYFWGWLYLEFRYPDELMEYIYMHTYSINIRLNSSSVGVFESQLATAPLLNGTPEVKEIPSHRFI
jgi:hypothetical protein